MKNSCDETNYRWYVLTLAALTHTIVAAMPTMCLPVFFKEISEDLGLSLVQIGLIWGSGLCPGIIIGIRKKVLLLASTIWAITLLRSDGPNQDLTLLISPKNFAMNLSAPPALYVSL